MLFIRQEKLKEGMRLAKPIYNKKGVLLYDRNSKLTRQGIESVHNFGLIGLYILEPAEPLPPMSEEDMEFERFTMMSTFAIEDELRAIHDKDKNDSGLEQVATQVIKRYGHLDHKINFVQSLRSREDKYYKHALNTAILTAMIARKLNLKHTQLHDAVMTALIMDIGMLDIPDELRDKTGEELSEGDIETIERLSMAGTQYIGQACSQNPVIKRIAVQVIREMEAYARNEAADKAGKSYYEAKVVKLAAIFDNMTAMNDYDEPSSEISAIRFLIENDEMFEPEITEALVKSINIVVPGCSVELNTGEKALVINENERNILKPIVLTFSDNKIIDLGQELIYGGLYIKDVMKTMDNRCVVDKSALAGFGVNV